MKIITLGFAAALVVGSIGLAHANLVTNGDFSATSPGHTAPAQFNNQSGTCGISGNNSWGGEFVSGWTTNTGGYAIWYPSAAAASGVQACTRYGNTGNQFLPPAVTAAPTGTSTFVGLDGQSNLNTWIQQTLTNVTVGDKYTVNFYWASTQEMSRTGDTTEKFKVSLGGQSFLTGTKNIGTHGWSGWTAESMTFTADSTNPILQFLSIGTPANLPPFALLSDVSVVRKVPEPPVLAMFGGGLLGLGLLAMYSRRRRHGADGDSDIG